MKRKVKYNGVSNLLNAHKAFAECGGYAMVEEILSKKPNKQTKRCMYMIEKAYEAEKE